MVSSRSHLCLKTNVTDRAKDLVRVEQYHLQVQRRTQFQQTTDFLMSAGKVEPWPVVAGNGVVQKAISSPSYPFRWSKWVWRLENYLEYHGLCRRLGLHHCGLIGPYCPKRDRLTTAQVTQRTIRSAAENRFPAHRPAIVKQIGMWRLDLKVAGSNPSIAVNFPNGQFE